MSKYTTKIIEIRPAQKSKHFLVNLRFGYFNCGPAGILHLLCGGPLGSGSPGYVNN